MLFFIKSLWPGDTLWVHIGSGNGLFPDSTKPSAEQMFSIDLSSVRSNDIHIWAVSHEIPQPLITKISLKITYVKFHSYLPGANDLIQLTDSTSVI